MIRPAANASEAAAALALAWEAFAERTPTSEGASYKEKLWHADPSYSPDNIIVARSGADTLAVVRLVPRTVMRARQAYPVAGISSVCVAESARGSGLGADIMHKTLEIAAERGFDFAFLFARKALDGYYTKFGFHGLASYSRVLVEPPAPSTNVSLAPARWADAATYARAYAHSYGECFGWAERSPDYWKFVREKLGLLPDARMYDVVLAGTIAGYAIASAQAIHEIAIVPDLPADAAPALIGALARQMEKPDRVELTIAPQHKLVPSLAQLDTVFTRRQCVYGGHMGAILNGARLLEKLSSRVEASGAQPRRRQLGGIELDWDGRHCSARKASGPWSFADVCTALGTHGAHPEAARVDVPLPLDIALCDQY